MLGNLFALSLAASFGACVGFFMAALCSSAKDD